MNIFKLLFGSVPGLSPQEAHAKLKDKPLVLDVREKDEYRLGHIDKAKNIPLGQIKNRLGELPQDRAIICVCQSGSRSRAATQQLRAAGLDALNLQGGMSAWVRAGLPVKR